MKHGDKILWRAAHIVVLAALGGIVASSIAHAAPISLTTLGSPYSQDFDTLANTGTVNTTLPAGWELSESGTSTRNNAAYAAGTGSDNTGDVYSFGAAASGERAFGTLRSSTLVPIIGVSFTNNTGATITSLTVSYTGEQWRLGVEDRGSSDRIDFQISTDATSLTSGTFVDVDALDFLSPATTGLIGTRDGNAAANRTALSSTIAGLSIADGATFWIRWQDFDISLADDGLAVDDFQITPTAAVPEPATLALLAAALLGLAVVRRRWPAARTRTRG